MVKVNRLYNRIEPFSALFWALGIVRYTVHCTVYSRGQLLVVSIWVKKLPPPPLFPSKCTYSLVSAHLYRWEYILSLPLSWRVHYYLTYEGENTVHDKCTYIWVRVNFQLISLGGTREYLLSLPFSVRVHSVFGGYLHAWIRVQFNAYFWVWKYIWSLFPWGGRTF